MELSNWFCGGIWLSDFGFLPFREIPKESEDFNNLG